MEAVSCCHVQFAFSYCFTGLKHLVNGTALERPTAKAFWQPSKIKATFENDLAVIEPCAHTRLRPSVIKLHHNILYPFSLPGGFHSSSLHNGQ